MTALLWSAGAYLAIALVVFFLALHINDGHFGGHSIWTLAGISLAWPLWLILLAGAVLFDR